MNLIFDTSRGKSRLNPFLVEQQKLTKRDVKKIFKLHQEKSLVFDEMETSDDLRLVEEVKQLEFKLQDAWKFPRDKNWHRWFEVPRCTCPKMDNIDMLGCNLISMNMSCIWHGVKTQEEKEFQEQLNKTK